MRRAQYWEFYGTERQAERLMERARRNQELAAAEERHDDEKVWWTVAMAALEAVKNLKAARGRAVRKKGPPRIPKPILEPKPRPIRRDWLGVPEKLE